MKFVFRLAIFLLLMLNGLIIPAQSELNIVSYNIRYDNPDDPFSWSDRKNLIASRILTAHADVVGFQEALNHQAIMLKELLPGYKWTGVGRDNGMEEGEFCAIFYNAKRLKLIESSTFWLSGQPELIGSKGWDAACIRICTWAQFTSRNEKDTFYFFNVHLDHIGQESRVESTKLILQRINELCEGKKILLAGDFNCTPDQEPVRLIGQSGLINIVAQHEKEIPSSCTYNNFKYVRKGRQIDYIFTSPEYKTVSISIPQPVENQIIPSDHNPIVARIILE
jgi:endonuclease/exonuclease/phosphatase family metal-dependent hydrolase